MVSMEHGTMTIPIVRCPEIVSVSGYNSMTESEHNDQDFKSEFAKQLEQTLTPVTMEQTLTPVTSVDQGSSMARLSQVLQQNEELRRAKEEFMRMKQENLRLKYQIEKQKLEEERYQKLQYEVEHLTTRLHKVNKHFLMKL